MVEFHRVYVRLKRTDHGQIAERVPIQNRGVLILCPIREHDPYLLKRPNDVVIGHNIAIADQNSASR